MEKSLATAQALDQAQILDQNDPLAIYRDRFVGTENETIYLDGNSLGRLPKASLHTSQALVEHQWGQRLIRAWNEGWFEAPRRIGAKIAKLIGAKDHEVIVADATTVNLFKLAVAALKAQHSRYEVITDSLNFPSDLYVMQGVIDLLDKGHQLRTIDSHDDIHGPVEAIRESLSENTALLYLSHTLFKSGYTYDMKALTAVAHEVGALTLWDLSHSVGSLDLKLNEAGADLAVGCTYKYLNGGPGAPAFIYIREDLQAKLTNPIPGWMGKKNLFDFSPHYEAAEGMQSFLTGTPAVLSLELIEPGLDIFLEVGLPAIREKSIKQSEYLLALFDAYLAPHGFSLNSPRDAAWRGSHISIGHPQGLGIDLAMIKEKDIIPDFRPPDNIRLGIAPLYTSYKDLYRAVLGIEDIMANKRYESYADHAGVVT